MIKIDPLIPLTQHFGSKYELPDSMADAVEQYRIDALQEHMDAHGITERNIVQLMASDEGLKAESFDELCDPLKYYGDLSQMAIKAGVNPILPPVPTTLADCGIGDPSIWAIPSVPQSLLQADEATIAKVAAMVAVSFCDDGFKHVDRATSLRYILINNRNHPASEFVTNNCGLWQDYRREISIPDMVATRKADFIRFFEQRGQPLAQRELECFSTAELLEHVMDLRFSILAQNRHILFCSRCVSASTSLLRQLNQTQESAFIC